MPKQSPNKVARVAGVERYAGLKGVGRLVGVNRARLVYHYFRAPALNVPDSRAEPTARDVAGP